jgi:hypothetical protein
MRFACILPIVLMLAGCAAAPAAAPTAPAAPPVTLFPELPRGVIPPGWTAMPLAGSRITVAMPPGSHKEPHMPAFFAQRGEVVVQVDESTSDSPELPDGFDDIVGYVRSRGFTTQEARSILDSSGRDEGHAVARERA